LSFGCTRGVSIIVELASLAQWFGDDEFETIKGRKLELELERCSAQEVTEVLEMVGGMEWEGMAGIGE
jgi:hypothetical protein